MMNGKYVLGRNMSASNAIGGKEASARRFMRASVVTIFVIIGPLILILMGLNAIPDTQVTVMIDLFKIWLGAVIGISTNLLQQQNQ